MYNKKQINVEDNIGSKTIVLGFSPIAENIGSRTFLHNVISIYSKLNPRRRCLVLDMTGSLSDSYPLEKMVNNVKVRVNPNFENVFMLSIGKLRGRTNEVSLMSLLVEKLGVDIVFIKNDLLGVGDSFRNLSEKHYLQKNFLMTDLDSENALSLYKELLYGKKKNDGTIVLNCGKNDTFKYKKLNNLLEIKEYSKIVCRSNNYGIIEYNRKKRQDLFKDIKSVNETDIYMEYEDNLNVLLGKPTKGFGLKWLKKRD